MTRGQALVEFALVLPIFLALMLGFAELATLFASRQAYQNGADVLADWAAVSMAENPDGESWRTGWAAVVSDETARADCEQPELSVTYDGAHEPGDRVFVRWQCRYTPKVAPGWSGLAVTVESAAVVPLSAPEPTPTPTPT
jgi:Flp pilus assembly protein TadG